MCLRLRVEHVRMREHGLADELREHVDVVGQAQLVELIEPRGRPGEEAQPQAGEPELGQRAHDQQIRVSVELRQEAVAREGVIGLVDDHEAGRGADHALHEIAVEQVAGRIVRIGEPEQRRPMLLDRGEQGGSVDREIGLQRHAHVADAGGGGEHAIHHEGRLDAQHHRTRPRDRQGQHLDDLVRAVAEQQRHALGDVHRLPQPLLQPRRPQDPGND